MKSEYVNDVRRRLKKIQNSFSIESFEFQDLITGRSVEKLMFSDGICTLIGRNGAGKSTVLTLIKQAVNGDFSNSKTVSLKIFVKNKAKNESIVNTDGKNAAFSEVVEFKERCHYLNYAEKVPKFKELMSQSNFGELLEQHENIDLKENEVDQLTYLVGNKYDSIQLYELDEYEEEIGEDLPFFEVKRSDGSAYNSSSMGLGEFLLFLYWWKIRKNLSKDNILLIEEPEAFLFPGAQQRFANFLVEQASEKKLWMLLSSHASAFYGPVNTRILLNQSCSKITGVVVPKNDMLESILELEVFPRNLILVEDTSAEKLLTKLLAKHEASVLANWHPYGVKASHEQLQKFATHFDFSKLSRRIFVGIDPNEFDCNLPNIISNYSYIMTKINNNFIKNTNGISVIRVPGTYNPDRDLLNAVLENEKEFCELVDIPLEKFIAVKSTFESIDVHDWIEKASAVLSLSIEKIFDSAAEIFSRDENVKNSLVEICTILDSH